MVTNKPEFLGVTMRLFFRIALLLAATALTRNADAQISDDVVKIGVLSDQTGVGADASGPNAAYAARMAVRDFGGTVLGKAIEVVDSDILMKPDVAVGVARRWFDTEGVDVIVDLPVSSAALAVQELAREKQKILLISGAATSDITGKVCAPFTLHWADDTFTLATALSAGLLDQGEDTWFFLTADYALGASLQRDALATINKRGRFIGEARFPNNSPDFASFLLRLKTQRQR
jgi:branched-chain amino acid transport system substrate-binding protein